MTPIEAAIANIRAVKEQCAFGSYACAGDPSRQDELKTLGIWAGSLEKALSALRTIPQPSEITVTQEQYDKFVAMLDAPPKDIPALKKLLTGPGVLEQPSGDARGDIVEKITDLRTLHDLYDQCYQSAKRCGKYENVSGFNEAHVKARRIQEQMDKVISEYGFDRHREALSPVDAVDVEALKREIDWLKDMADSHKEDKPHTMNDRDFGHFILGIARRLEKIISRNMIVKEKI